MLKNMPVEISLRLKMIFEMLPAGKKCNTITIPIPNIIIEISKLNL